MNRGRDDPRKTEEHRPDHDRQRSVLIVFDLFADRERRHLHNDEERNSKYDQADSHENRRGNRILEQSRKIDHRGSPEAPLGAHVAAYASRAVRGKIYTLLMSASFAKRRAFEHKRCVRRKDRRRTPTSGLRMVCARFIPDCIMPVALNGPVEIHYEVLGTEGPVVLFVSGLGMRGEQWTPLSRALLGRGFRAIQFDNRDIGRSSTMVGIDYSIADMATDTLAVLDHAGMDKVHVVGISMGGMITQEMLLQRPDRFSRAVLMATWAGGQTMTLPESRIVEMLVPRMDPNDALAVEAHLRKLYAAITAPGFAEKNAHLIDMIVSFALEQRVSSEAISRQLRAIGQFSAWDRLTDMTVPTLVVHGEADSLIPYENGAQLSRRIPGARLRSLPGVGHLVPLEAPFEAFGAITDFFS